MQAKHAVNILVFETNTLHQYCLETNRQQHQKESPKKSTREDFFSNEATTIGQERILSNC